MVSAACVWGSERKEGGREEETFRGLCHSSFQQGLQDAWKLQGSPGSSGHPLPLVFPRERYFLTIRKISDSLQILITRELCGKFIHLSLELPKYNEYMFEMYEI